MTDINGPLGAALGDRYRLERELGAGGMATVYLAEDLRHKRKVAVKVLHPDLSAAIGSERFLQEIELTANLQHPHILPLFDSGEAAGQLFYVMPFVEGVTLRTRLERERQLPIDEAVGIAREVADALQHAHERGVIHRDIKPENILLHGGHALVADFGIALALHAAPKNRLTQTGLSLGTPHYMSPEQAAAESVITPRTDIYSLGCVLYECLAGEPPHVGATAQQLILKIMTEPAKPVQDLRSSVPPHVSAALAQALEKVPADRFTSARAFADALDTSGVVAGRAASVAVARGRRRFIWPGITVAALAVAWAGWQRSPAPGAVDRLHLVLPPGHQLQVSSARSDGLDISPDGRRLVYENQVGGTSQLAVRDMSSFDTRVLDGTTGARGPFFSPKGDWVAFFAAGSLQRVPVGEGSPVVIAPATGYAFGGHWAANDQIVFADEAGLHRVSISGAEAPRRITLPDSVDFGPSERRPLLRPRWPQLLPGERHVMVTIDGGTIIVDLTDSSVQYLFDGEQAQYLTTGHLIYDAGAERVRARAFDLRRRALTGVEIPVLDNVFKGPGSGAATFAVAARSGTLVYAQGSFDRELVLVDRSGTATGTPAERRGYRFPRVSPDGRRVAVTVDPRPSDLWIIDLERGTAERQQTPMHDGWGVWSPDGRRVAFLAGFAAEGVRAPMAWRAYPFASDPVGIMRKGTEAVYPAEWTADDRLIGQTDRDLLSVSVKDGSVDTVLATSAHEMTPRLDPSGRWLAYVSDASGTNEVYVQGYPSANDLQVVSLGGGLDPNWAHDGNELFYRSGSAIFAVPVRTSPRFEVRGPPRRLFGGPFDFTQTGNWDVTKDRRFVMIRTNAPTTTQFMVITNWLAELSAAPR